MSDAEIIATFMDPARALGRWWGLGSQTEEFGESVQFRDQSSPMRARIVYTNIQLPNALTLDALHEVEAKLTDAQWDAYYHQFGRYSRDGLAWTAPDRMYKWALHADAEQKTKALAAVLRPVVEGVTVQPQNTAPAETSGAADRAFPLKEKEDGNV